MDATIIAGSLNDKELKSSIDSLVSYVDKKVQGMATNFDNELKRMKESLKNLGDIKFDGSGASESGSSRRTKRNNEETKSVRETTVAYDQLAVAVNNATRPKSAEQSFYSFIQNYREHAAKLASELKAMPSASLDRQIAEYERFEREINNTQRKIQELRQQLNEVGANPNRSRFEIKAITDEIGLLENKVKQLTSEQISSTRRIANEDNMAINQKRALYERTVQLVKELTTEQNNSTNATRKQNEAQDQLTRKIQRQAEIIRQRLQENGYGQTTWGTKVIYDPNDARNVKMKQAQLSIEEQLLNAHREQVRITQERIASEQRANQAKKETVSTTQAQAQAEQQVTQAQQQRKSAQAKKTFQSYTEFSQALAHVLGLQQQEIKLADSETASYNRLQQTLKTLQSAYNQLSNSERNSDNGRTLVASMHEVQRAIQKIQSQAARPVNLMAAMGLSEKTLDDINYKMQMLSRYRNGIDLTNPKSKDEIKRVNEELSRLKETCNKMIGANTRYIHSNELLGRSFDYIKNRIAFVLTIGTMTQFTKSIYEIRGQYELLERSIGILFDSMQQGSQIFAELNAMAIKSPFTTMELGAAAKQLSAYDIAAKDVVDTTRRLADMAAAVGVPIERLTYALGQIKAYGYLNARDARMFANAGIPLVQNLADMYTKLEGRLVSVGDIYDRIKKKAISFEDVLKVVNEMTGEGGRFFNFQEKAADTLKVKLANLTLAYNNMLNEIGKSNQTLITAPLVGLKKLYENWRSINNIIKSLIVSYGLLKGAQILYIAYTSKVSIATATADVASKKLVGTLYAMKGALASLAFNPFTWITVVLASLGYMYFQMRDLNEATEQFNKSISQNAQENIDSINKFFNEYKKDIDTINSLNTADQQKMWERIRDEIEKTSKNASQYIEILERMGDVSARVNVAADYLSQLQQIQQEAQRLADHGAFSVGGGFGDDSLAQDLQDYERTMNDVLKRYGSLEEAQKDFNDSLVAWSSGQYAVKYYNEALKEAEKELQGFVGTLNEANLGKVLGDGSIEEQLANLREFANIVRDNFLATEKGQKISTEGRALLNRQLDNWIAKKGVQNRLLTEENAQIEANRTAWEAFFNQLNKKEKETVDYLVETNQTGSDEFKKIWDNASNSMKDSAITSYQAIQDQIAELRNTPDIVINVVYKQNKEQLDAQQQQYKDTFLTPEGKGVLSAENYLKQVQELTTKYGRFQKKEGEDNVEWEKRLGEIYRDNETKIKRLNAQLKESANLSEIDRKAKEADRDALVDENKVLDEIKAKQNFNYDKDKKNGKGRKDEDIVAEALKQELQLIREMQSNYDKLRKSGVSNMDAIDLASKGYEATILRINNVLQKFGIDKFNAANFAGKDVRSLLKSLEEQRAALLASGKVKTSSLQALDVEIQKLTVDAKTYDMKKVTDGLNSELGKIKDEYELAIELDANPELGGIFADMMGLNKEQLSQMPKDFDGVVERLQKIIDNKLGAGKFNLIKNLNKASFDAWLEANKQGKQTDDALAKSLESIIDYANKVLLDSSKKQKEEWNKLLEKYAEYEYKVTQIQKEAERERETARKKGASQEILDSINNWEKQELARLSFEEFQKTPEWIVATGDLANMSKSAIAMLIEQIERYKRSASNLSPKQIKQLNSALSKLYKEQRKNNPFKAISNMLDEAKERMATFDEDIKKTQEEIDKLTKKKKESIVEGIADEETDNELKKAIKRLKELKEAREKTGKVDASSWVSSINETIGAVQSAIGVFNDLAKAIGGVDSSDLDKVFSVVDKAGQGAAIGAQIGGGWGALIGGVAGAATGLISIFAGAANERITAKVEESERAVKRLELAYIDLEHAVNEAYGMATIGANMAAKANKELQLVELKRQLALERSRDSKHRDEDKIIDMQKQIKELEYDIADTVDSIVNDLLGISSVGDAMENMMDAFVEALRSGEDAMATFDENVDEMIANMVKKMYVTKILQPWFEEQWNKIQEQINQRAGDVPEKIANIQSKISLAKNADVTDNNSLVEALRALGMSDDQIHLLNWYNEFGQLDHSGANARLKAAYEKMLKEAEQKEAELQRQLTNATSVTVDDIKSFAGGLETGRPLLQSWYDEIDNTIKELGLINDDLKNSKLSALQQGIQGITEDTAGAIEAYMNIVSQRVFEQNLYLQEIRDHLNNFDLDVQLGTLSQMLLQLQQSYQVQQNIESILTGVLNPSGRAIVVELNS